MKLLLFILLISILSGCANNRREALETICKGVKTTEKTCSTAVRIAGKCSNCIPIKESTDLDNTDQVDISTLELQKNNMLW